MKKRLLILFLILLPITANASFIDEVEEASKYEKKHDLDKDCAHACGDGYLFEYKIGSDDKTIYFCIRYEKECGRDCTEYWDTKEVKRKKFKYICKNAIQV